MEKYKLNNKHYVRASKQEQQRANEYYRKLGLVKQEFALGNGKMGYTWVRGTAPIAGSADAIALLNKLGVAGDGSK